MNNFQRLIHLLFCSLVTWINVNFRSERGSFSIDTAFIEGFRNNIMMLSQQKEARLFGKSRNEQQIGEVDSYEQIDASDAVDILDRHGDTPIVNTPHARRQVALEDADWGDLIDKMDRVRMLIRPDDAYVQTAVWALNRKKDDIFIAAALGPARTGKKGLTTATLGFSNQLVCVDDAGGGAAGLNVFALTLLQQKFHDADIDEDMVKHLAIGSRQLQQLLNDPKATNADFTTVRALVNGKLNEFMGFVFTRTNRLPLTTVDVHYNAADGSVVVGPGPSTLGAGARRCIAWSEQGMLSAHAVDTIARISERDDKRYSTQIYVAHSVGAVRMEEDQVVEFFVTEA